MRCTCNEGSDLFCGHDSHALGCPCHPRNVRVKRALENEILKLRDELDRANIKLETTQDELYQRRDECLRLQAALAQAEARLAEVEKSK